MLLKLTIQTRDKTYEFSEVPPMNVAALIQNHQAGRRHGVTTIVAGTVPHEIRYADIERIELTYEATR